MGSGESRWSSKNTNLIAIIVSSGMRIRRDAPPGSGPQARFSRMSFVAREVKVPDQFTVLAGLCARRTGLPGLWAGCSTRSCANAHGDLPPEKAVEERLGRTSSRAPWPHPKPLPSQKHSEERRALVLEVSLDRQPHPQRRGAEVTSNRYVQL